MLASFAATLVLPAQDASSGYAETITQLSPARLAEIMRSIATLQSSNASGNLTTMGTAQSFSQWTSAAGLGPGSYLATRKSFSDRVTNLLRYAMNLDLTGEGSLLPQPVVTTTDAGPAISLTYRLRKIMPDVVLTPQYSTDLTHWVNVPLANVQQLDDDDANTARYCATMLMPAGSTLYLHVVAQPNNTPVTQWPVSAGGNGHYYQAIVGLGQVSLASAQSYAATAGGYLVTITSAEENAFVFNLVHAPQFWVNSGQVSFGPMLGVTPVSQPIGPPELNWVNNEGLVRLTYNNWAAGDSPDSRNTYNGVQYFCIDSSNLLPTWTAFARGVQPSFVIEFDHDPAGN